MSNLFSSFAGTLIEFQAADPVKILQFLNECGFYLRNIIWLDNFTVQFQIPTYKSGYVLKLLQKRAETFRVIQTSFIHRNIEKLKHHPVLILGTCLLMFLSLLLPSRVLFINVEGNQSIPSRQIIEAAQDCGIQFGASRREVRNEKVKNAMISQIPQLKWVGVNTEGCVATISVREGNRDETDTSQYPIGNIIANRDGVILSVTTLRGTPVCRVGQAVIKDQLLISGYTDCNIYVQATQAEGEILALTNREITVITPLKFTCRLNLLDSKRQFRLKIGNSLINLYKGSGISDTTCVKIYEEKCLGLPGGFSLPLGIICEEFLYYETGSINPDAPWLVECTRDYLKNQMVAGTIISDDITITKTEEAICLSGRYDCTEMIGQIKLEENAAAYGNDGKNR